MTIQHQHIIELSNRYQLCVNDNGFILYQLTLNNEGVWKRSKGQVCRNFEAVVETLERGSADLTYKYQSSFLKFLHSLP
ncbi:hypothetical protein OW731_12935 [Avibacterium paragallinarum]|uniref:hypothetical protein n=1 Tax=Avibacterium paragallinarum TaxID=728 RepID=UPI002285ECD2|nr:hypothetical protein [Avibacterium paragallinarum]WAM59361.1 hypothetical protein OW731_12935 [Avibacterium paragallinarum]